MSIIAMRNIGLSPPRIRLVALILCFISIPFIYYGIFFWFALYMDGPQRHTPSNINIISGVLWQICVWVLAFVGILGTIANLIVSILNIFIKNSLLSKTSIYFSSFVIILSVATAILAILSAPPLINPRYLQ